MVGRLMADKSIVEIVTDAHTRALHARTGSETPARQEG
jgi:hypothetical protein